jgi:sodium/bile acid cotransporter 3/5
MRLFASSTGVRLKLVCVGLTLLCLSSFGHSLGEMEAESGIANVSPLLPYNVATGAAVSTATASFSPTAATAAVGGTGLKLEIYPAVVNANTGQEFNFTLRLVDACDHDESCTDDGSHDPRQIEVFFEVQSQFFTFYNYQNSSEEGIDRSVVFNYYPGRTEQQNKTVFGRSSILGFYDIKFYTLENGNHVAPTKSYFANEPSVHAIVARHDGNLLFYINFFVGGLIMGALFFMGIEIDLAIVLKVLKRPIGPVIGFISQFIFMPLCAWGIGSLLLTQDYERLGLILLGSAPGGNLSNFWTSMFGGDVNLSVTMTMISSVCSFGMTSFWVWMLGSQFAGDKHLKIPYHMIAFSLAAFIVPLVAGTWFKYRYREFATRMLNKFARPYFMLCLVVVPSVGLLTNTYYFYLVTWRHLLAGLLVGALGYLSGAGLAWICRQGRPQIIAISLETAIQNAGIAYLILSLSFPSPTSEIALIPVISFFFCSTGPILFVVYAGYEAYKRFFGDNADEDLEPMKAVSVIGKPDETEKMSVTAYYQDVIKSNV